MKSTHIAGDTFQELVGSSVYYPTDGWTLKLRLIPRSGAGAPIEVTGSAAADGFSHLLEVDAADTASWAAGEYGWVQWVERVGESFTLETGQITIKPDPRQVTGALDTRSLAQRTLDALEQAYATFSQTRGTVKRYRIMEREMEFNTSAEIQEQINYWAAKVRAEREAARIAAGGKPRNRLLMRFTRPR